MTNYVRVNTSNNTIYLRQNNQTPYVRYSNDSVAFSPSSVGTLRLWLDASDDTTLTKNLVGGSVYDVSSWSNKVNYVAETALSQSNSVNRPLIETNVQNSKSALRFGGNSKYLTGSSLSAFKFLHGSSGGVIFFVGRMTATSNLNNYWNSFFTTTNSIEAAGPGFNVWFEDRVSNGSNNMLRFFLTGAETFLNSGNYTDFGSKVQNNFFPSSNSFVVLSFVIDPAASNRVKAYLNGSLVASSPSNSNTTTANQLSALLLGRVDTIGEVLIYEGSLTSNDYTSVNSNLITKWGVS